MFKFTKAEIRNGIIAFIVGVSIVIINLFIPKEQIELDMKEILFIAKDVILYSVFIYFLISLFKFFKNRKTIYFANILNNDDICVLATGYLDRNNNRIFYYHNHIGKEANMNIVMMMGGLNMKFFREKEEYLEGWILLPKVAKIVTICFKNKLKSDFEYDVFIKDGNNEIKVITKDKTIELDLKTLINNKIEFRITADEKYDNEQIYPVVFIKSFTF